MEKIELSEHQKELLKTILNDKYSKGAYLGHIHNLFAQYSMSGKKDVPIQKIVRDSLVVREVSFDLAGLEDNGINRIKEACRTGKINEDMHDF